jgi:hypothetical protein
MMVLGRTYLTFCCAVLLFMSSACNDEPTSDQNSEPAAEMGNEESPDFTGKSTSSEVKVNNPETKEKVEKLKEVRKEKLDIKVNASPYKGLNDDEIKTKLEDKLKAYRESCDTAIIDQISDQMAFDAALSSFKERQGKFNRAFFKKLQSAKKDCK